MYFLKSFQYLGVISNIPPIGGNLPPIGGKVHMDFSGVKISKKIENDKNVFKQHQTIVGCRIKPY